MAWSPAERSRHKIVFSGGLHTIAYGAVPEVSEEFGQFVVGLLAERLRRSAPCGSRALSCFWQAVLGLRWLRDRMTPGALVRDQGNFRAAGCRCRDGAVA